MQLQKLQSHCTYGIPVNGATIKPLCTDDNDILISIDEFTEKQYHTH